VEVHLRLVPGRIRELGSATPMMVTTFPMMVKTLVGLSASSPGTRPAGQPSRNAKTSSLPSGPTKSRGLGPARAAGAKWFWRPRPCWVDAADIEPVYSMGSV